MAIESERGSASFYNRPGQLQSRIRSQSSVGELSNDGRASEGKNIPRRYCGWFFILREALKPGTRCGFLARGQSFNRLPGDDKARSFHPEDRSVPEDAQPR